MRWILVDVVVVLASLVLLGLLLWRLWRRVVALVRALGTASKQVAGVTAQLETLQQSRPDPQATPAGHVPGAPQRPRGVRS